MDSLLLFFIQSCKFNSSVNQSQPTIFTIVFRESIVLYQITFKINHIWIYKLHISIQIIPNNTYIIKWRRKDTVNSIFDHTIYMRIDRRKNIWEYVGITRICVVRHQFKRSYVNLLGTIKYIFYESDDERPLHWYEIRFI